MKNFTVLATGVNTTNIAKKDISEIIYYNYNKKDHYSQN